MGAGTPGVKYEPRSICRERVAAAIGFAAGLHLGDLRQLGGVNVERHNAAPAIGS